MRSSAGFIQKKLDERRLAGTYRSLKPENSLIDFCSNDYLGFARSPVLKKKIEEEFIRHKDYSIGSTGSRLLSGNSNFIEELERQIAAVHYCEAALIFSSGYDANVGLFSSILQKGDTVITDELIHASIVDGTRMSNANRYKFRHNDLQSLENKLKIAKGTCYVAVESVYSMDGDSPCLSEIIGLTEKYGANLIVDEAHAVGLFGQGLVDRQLTERVFAKIVTFGKALGCHGAVVLGSALLKDYLVNFARSFIYTTAPSFHQVAATKMAYGLLRESTAEANILQKNIMRFKAGIIKSEAYPLIISNSAIQCIPLKSNEKAISVAAELQKSGFDIRPILSPTVSAGSERIRVCLHSFNTESEIISLTTTINQLTDAG